jgi:hypothetical protein
LASIRCGHSYANFYNQSDAIKTALFADIPRLPFLFSWIDGRMVVTASQGHEDAIAPGTVVHRINGTTTSAILAALMPFTRADGGNDGKRRDLLGCQGNEEWETFDLFFGNLWPQARTFVMDVTQPDGRRATLQRRSTTLAERQGGWASMRDAMKKDQAVWTFTIDAGGTATLTMPGWAVYNSKWDWQAFLDDAFGQISARNCRRLVIDLRGNEGGLDCGDEVIARLIDVPFTPESYERRVRFERVPERLLAHMSTWDKNFATLGVDATPLGGGFRALPTGPVERIEPKGPPFRGKVAVIVDAGNSSATWRFASIMKTARLGKLVGQTTGGNQRGINGGAFYFLTLPKSGFEVDVPLIGYFPRMPKADAGLDPDVKVSATAGDVAAGYDRVMAVARDQTG